MFYLCCSGVRHDVTYGHSNTDVSRTRARRDIVPTEHGLEFANLHCSRTHDVQINVDIQLICMRLPTTYGLNDRVCNTHTGQRRGATSSEAVSLVQLRVWHTSSDQCIAQGLCKRLTSQRSPVLHGKQRRIKTNAVSSLDSGAHVLRHCDCRAGVTA